MKQVVNADGTPIKGLFRQKDGSLIVLDVVALNKSNSENKRALEVVELKERVEQLEQLIEKLLKK